MAIIKYRGVRIRTEKVPILPRLRGDYLADAVSLSNWTDLVDVIEWRSLHVLNGGIKYRSTGNIDSGSSVAAEFAVLNGLVKEPFFVRRRCVKTRRAGR
jgi:hypothetical protein